METNISAATISDARPGCFVPHAHEKVILHLRRHWLVLFAHWAFFGFLMLVPGILYVVLGDIIRNLVFPLGNLPWQEGITLLVGTYYLFIWLFILTSWTDYVLDLWIVTNQRVINTEQHGLFSRIVAEHDLKNVQDVTAEVHGIIQTVFGFGDVIIQTASEKQRFIFKQIPDPYTVARRILFLVRQTHDDNPQTP